MYLNICEKSLTSVFIFCFKENWEKVPFLKVLDKETPLKEAEAVSYVSAECRKRWNGFKEFVLHRILYRSCWFLLTLICRHNCAISADNTMGWSICHPTQSIGNNSRPGKLLDGDEERLVAIKKTVPGAPLDLPTLYLEDD